jgi:hypothetical protein
MANQNGSPHQEILVETIELDRELISRGMNIPGANPFRFKDKTGTPQRDAVMSQLKTLYRSQSLSLAPSSPSSLAKALPAKRPIDPAGLIEQLNRRLDRQQMNQHPSKGIRGKDLRRDYWGISNEQVGKNADCVAAICQEEDLIDLGNGCKELEVKNYGETFNLCECESFREQPIAAGRLCTGFLVKPDVIATAGHCADEKNLGKLRFIFGYKMTGSGDQGTRIPQKNIYRGERIIRREFDRSIDGADWTLVKLDRCVKGQSIVTLSRREIYRRQHIYILGHPVGLPLKFVYGAWVCDIGSVHFAADLTVYCGNSGSPVFCSETHEVIGIVANGDSRDFRWTGKCWKSIKYPLHPLNPSSQKMPQCVRISNLLGYLDSL